MSDPTAASAHGSSSLPPVGTPLDLVVTGTVFLDLILTGLRAAPVGGREIMADGMGSSPGGAATLAVAASRLGVATGLVAAFGSDVYGDFCWSTLEEDEGVDLSASRRLEGWHSPVTVSLAYDDDRAMITHAHEPPIDPDELFGHVPEAAVCFADVGTTRAPWVDGVVDRGSLVFADVGWDDTGRLGRRRRCASGSRAATPSCPTPPRRWPTPARTTRAPPWRCIRDWVPLAVVTAGSGGAYAADDRTGETVWVPGLPRPGDRPDRRRRRVPRRAHGRHPARAGRLHAADPLRQPRRGALGARRRRRARRPGLGRRLRLVDRPRPGQPARRATTRSSRRCSPAWSTACSRGPSPPSASTAAPTTTPGTARGPGTSPSRTRRLPPRRPGPGRSRPPGPARPAIPSRRPPPPLRRTDDPHPSASHPRRRPGRHRPAGDHRRLRPRRGGRQRAPRPAPRTSPPTSARSAT